jgi:peptidoglycan/xylan/chitin deacetylase (PgdA/CDA1 family)
MSKISNFIDGLRSGHKLELSQERGLVSFTFDDFPESAAKVAATLLEECSVRGTFYMSMSLMGIKWKPRNPNEHGAYPTEEDLRTLVKKGHELGCHTYSHTDCSKVRISELVADLDKNLELLNEISGLHTVSSFAYPFGLYTNAVQRELSSRFGSCRSIAPGINSGRIDLCALKANAIESRSNNLPDLLSLIEQASREKSWVIFYTHDVSDNPTDWGCTPVELRQLVEAAAASTCDVLTVRNALGKISAQFG